MPTILGIIVGFIAGRGHDDRANLKIYRYNKENPDALKRDQKIDPIDVNAIVKKLRKE